MHLHKKFMGKVLMAALVGVMAGSMLAPSAGSTSLSYLGESSLAGMSVALEAYAEKSGADDTNVLADMGIVTEEKTAEATTVAEKHVAGLSLDEVEAYAETSAPAAEAAQAAEAEKEEPATIAASMLVASAGIAGETEKSAEAASAETESAAPAAGESTPAIQAAESATTAAAESQEISTSAAETAEETEAAVATAEVKEPSKYTNLGISIAPNYVNIRQEPNTDSEVVGKLYNGAAATICGTEGEWVLIESGHCQGYIKSEFLAIGADAEAVASDYGETVAKVTADGLRVRDDKSTEAAVLAVVSTDERYEVISESDEWVKIRVDDSTKGWVYKQFVDIDVIFEKGITIEEEQEKIRKEKEAEERRKAEEEARRKAEAEAAAKKKAEEEAKKKAEAEAAKKKSDSSKKKEDTSSKKKEDTSSKKKEEDSSSKKKEEDSSSKKKEEEKKSDEGGDGGSYDASTGAKVVAYAKQFVGNPYVYGGTSLTNGCDCSGFTMKVMEHFGISLPRSSYDQQFSGTSVSLNNLQPGDLILYAKNGRVNHVTIYIGGGQVVHASQPSVGIIISNMYYRTPYCARRVIH